MSKKKNLPKHLPQYSPINIAKTISATLPALKFQYAPCVVGDLKPDAKGKHGYNVFVPAGAGTLILEEQGCPIICPLIKLHFHAESEHHIDGKEFPLELHLVHKLPAPVAKATGSKLVVVGVLFDASRTKSKKNSTPASLRILSERIGSKGKAKPTEPFNLNHLLPPCDPSGKYTYYRYEGSLTTGKPLQETVSWFVLSQPVEFIAADIQPLIDAATDKDLKPQKINRRFVLRNF